MKSNFLKRYRMDNKQLMTIQNEIATQPNDRARVLVAGALLEDWLGMMTAVKIEAVRRRSLSDAEISEIFDNFGPMHSFEMKIRMSSALGVIDKPLRKDLETIKTIRNYFAHEPNPISFKDKDVQNSCEKLTLWKSVREPEADPSTASGKFTISVTAAMAMLAASVADDLIENARRITARSQNVT